jgi:hypothetical protein
MYGWCDLRTLGHAASMQWHCWHMTCNGATWETNAAMHWHHWDTWDKLFKLRNDIYVWCDLPSIGARGPIALALWHTTCYCNVCFPLQTHLHLNRFQIFLHVCLLVISKVLIHFVCNTCAYVVCVVMSVENSYNTLGHTACLNALGCVGTQLATMLRSFPTSNTISYVYMCVYSSSVRCWFSLFVRLVHMLFVL